MATATMDDLCQRCRQTPLHVKASELDPERYTQPYLDFMTENPTVFHAVAHYASRLTKHGFKELSERAVWTDHISEGGKYFVQRNGSSLIAFVVGEDYEPGNGAAIIAGHIDALTVKRKCEVVPLEDDARPPPAHSRLPQSSQSPSSRPKLATSASVSHVSINT